MYINIHKGIACNLIYFQDSTKKTSTKKTTTKAKTTTKKSPAKKPAAKTTKATKAKTAKSPAKKSPKSKAKVKTPEKPKASYFSFLSGLPSDATNSELPPVYFPTEGVHWKSIGASMKAFKYHI